METKNDFNLNNVVASWRQELLAQGEILPAEIRELESHLCLSIDGLKQRGLKEDEAFWVARRRLGPGEQIAAEFTKAKPYRLWQNRLHWLTVGVVGAYLWTTGLSFFSNVACKRLEGNGWWLAGVPMFAILSGGMVWLAATCARGYLRRVGRIFSSPCRMAFGWFLLVMIGMVLTYMTCQYISQPSPGSSGGMILVGASIEEFGTSLDNAILTGLMVLVTLGLNWRWKRLAAMQQ